MYALAILSIAIFVLHPPQIDPNHQSQITATRKEDPPHRGLQSPSLKFEIRRPANASKE
jgi:hypothetical protein